MMSRESIFVATAVAGLGFFLGHPAYAQRIGGSTASPTAVSPLNASSTGSSASTGGSSSSMGIGSASSFGSSSTGASTGTSTGASGTGTGSGQSGGGATSQFGPQFATGDGTLGQQMTQGAFAGAQSGLFVGSQFAGGQTSLQGSRGRGQTQPQFNAFSGNFNNFNPNFGQGQMGQRILPRPQLTIGFAVPAPPAAAVASNTTATLQSVQSLSVAQPRFSGVSVSTGASGTVVLSGSVPDDHSRQLAEILARLEPGVSDVSNQISVRLGPPNAPAAAGP